MTFKEALKIAYRNEEFCRIMENIMRRYHEGGTALSLLFSIGDEAFAIGYDGIDITKHKHTHRRSAWLIQNGKTLVIEEEKK